MSMKIQFYILGFSLFFLNGCFFDTNEINNSNNKSNIDPSVSAEIDFSDIPELDESFWKNAVQNPFYKPTKQVTTVRIDADVMQWLKAQGKGYQTRMNKILRDAMLNDLKNHP